MRSASHIASCLAIAALGSACGRVGFDAVADAAGGDAGPDASAGCPPSYVSISGGCYHVYATPMGWLNAELACEAEGAHLIVVADVAEHFVLHAMLMDASIARSWIGFSDRRVEAAFLWVGPAGVDPASDACIWGAGGAVNSDPADCVTQAAVPGCPDWEILDCASLEAYTCEYDGLIGDPASY